MSLLRSSLVVLLLSAPCFTQVSFRQSSVPTGSSPVQVILGDVNHDGILDMISLDQADRAVSIRLGKGDGTFRARNSYTVGGSPVGISTADFQKDGKADIVTVNRDTNTVSVLIGNGDGTFQAARNFAVGAAPDSIQVADFNGDGKTDISTADYDDNTISILPGKGDGSFGTRIVIAAGTQHPKNLVKGDFNGDGKMDLLFADCCQGTDVAFDTLRVLFNQGSLRFQQVGSFNLSVTQGLTVAKVDGDNRDDLLATYQGCHTPCIGGAVYTSNGDGSFTMRGSLDIDISSYNSPTRAVFSDFDGDGRKDAAVAVSCCGEGDSPNTNDALLVWMQQADGTFTPNPLVFPLGQGQRPADIAVGDVDRNKMQDIAIALENSDSIRIFLNAAASSCSQPSSAGIHVCSPTPGAADSSPVRVSAAASGAILRMEVWIDGAKKYQVNASALETSVALSPGSHRVLVQAIATSGTIYKSVATVSLK